METETSAAIAALGEAMKAGFARMESRMESRMDAGFASTDHFFELQQAQHVEFREEVRRQFAEVHSGIADLRNRVVALTERVDQLEHEVSQLRDYVTREIVEIRLELRALRARSDQTDELRRDIAQLTVRVDRLERRQQG